MNIKKKHYIKTCHKLMSKLSLLEYETTLQIADIDYC